MFDGNGRLSENQSLLLGWGSILAAWFWTVLGLKRRRIGDLEERVQAQDEQLQALERRIEELEAR